MTAAPAPRGEGPSSGRPVPPPEGYFAEGLDRLPDLPPHTELIDGSLVFMSPRMKFHMRVLRAIEGELVRRAPAHLEVCREMTVSLGARQRPETDLMVVRASGPRRIPAWSRRAISLPTSYSPSKSCQLICRQM